MLIIPIEGKIGWKNPPYVTILIVLVNCLVFFGFQTNDDRKMEKAFSDYFKSGLAGIEVPRYIEFLQSKDHDPAELDEMQQVPLRGENPVAVSILMEMETDSDFQDALYKGKIIRPDDPLYNRWEMLRREFEAGKNELITYKYGLIPAKFRPYTFFTNMFLHGSVGHLVGNMIFLWIFGCLLEMGCGRTVYGIGYLLVGLSASLFYAAVHHNSYVPAIGASGAISGLMGAFTVLYGLSRIKFFYWVGFYFDVFRLRAILLLPFWIGDQFFQFYFGENGNIAYMAHAGGLMGGAALGFAAKRFFTHTRKEFFQEKPVDKSPALMEEAMSRISRLDYTGARTILTDLLKINPDNLQALENLFTIDRQHPDDPGFSETAKRFLSALLNVRSEGEKVWKVYAEYMKIAGKPVLPVELQIRLFTSFCENRRLGDAEDIMGLLIRNKPDHPRLPTLLMKLIRGLEKSGAQNKAQEFRQMLIAKYPASQEARLAIGSP